MNTSAFKINTQSMYSEYWSTAVKSPVKFSSKVNKGSKKMISSMIASNRKRRGSDCMTKAVPSTCASQANSVYHHTKGLKVTLTRSSSKPLSEDHIKFYQQYLTKIKQKVHEGKLRNNIYMFFGFYR